jgi:DNA primase
MRFSEDFIEKVRESSNIVDVISSYTELKRSGHQWMGRCPFPDHAEKTPSFSVSQDKQVYHCFGCKRGGNIYTFLQEYSGMSFPESVEFLARKASLPLPEPTVSNAQSERGVGHGPKEKKKVLLKINQLAAAHFRGQLERLPPSHSLRAYLQRRGLTKEILQAFQIGYAAENWEGLVSSAKKSKVPLELASQLGLIKARDSGDGYFDLFRDRLMFPILAPNGDVLGFGGRILGEGQPKYLNSPDSPVFHKGRVLYGLHETAKFIRGRDLLVIVEGYMDLVSLYGCGIQYVAATMGTALTEDHARLISRYTRNVVVLFDGDEAGQRAQERSLPILLKAGLFARGLTLPDGMDPDDYAKKFGGDDLERQIQQAPELFEEFLRVQLKDYRATPQDQVRLVERVAPVLHCVEDQRLRSLYLDSICRSAMVKRTWLTQALAATWKSIEKKNLQVISKPYYQDGVSDHELNGSVPAIGFEAPLEKIKEKIVLSGADKLEIEILRLALFKPEYLQKLDEVGAIVWLNHQGVIQLHGIAQDFYRQSPEKFGSLTALLASKVDNPGMITWPQGAQHGASGEDVSEKYLSDCLKRLKSRYLQGQMRNLTRELRSQPSQQKLEQFLDVLREKENLK